MSNVRALPLSGKKVVIGEYMVDHIAEEKAAEFIRENYPDLFVVTTPEGKHQIPLQDILVMQRRFQEEKEAACKVQCEEGRRAGYEAGLEEGREDARKAVASLSGLLTDVTRQRHDLLADSKKHILDLILKISQRLTFTAAALDPEITMSIVSGAIDQLLDKNKIKVKVHPDHLPEVEQHIDRFRGADTAIKEFILEADPRIRIGGCFIETPSGDIDARLESMYDVIKQSFLAGEDVSL